MFQYLSGSRTGTHFLRILIIDLLSVLTFNANRQLFCITQQSKLDGCQAVRQTVSIGRDGISICQIVTCFRGVRIHTQTEAFAVYPDYRRIGAAGVAVLQAVRIIIPGVFQHGGSDQLP